MQGAYWLARALFFFSLSLSLWAVVTAAQQASIVRTLQVTGHERQTASVILRRRQKGSGGGGSGRSFAELNMLYVWQCSLMLMAYGWATLLVALTLHVCSPLIRHDADSGRKVSSLNAFP